MTITREKLRQLRQNAKVNKNHVASDLLEDWQITLEAILKSFYHDAINSRGRPGLSQVTTLVEDTILQASKTLNEKQKRGREII